MKTGKIIFIPLAIVLVGSILYGYGSNIVKLIDLDFESPYKAEALRTIGIIPPVGVIMGYVEFDEEKS